eukprot:gb/GECG01012600.1/.p1 GENE.gb/GECG01012600.1/~~gb/GECG01012600.1/.p1  ORF type:complete len:525 (+),score=52.52 gb/GECG01012600.1/:1-1575(+)
MEISEIESIRQVFRTNNGYKDHSETEDPVAPGTVSTASTIPCRSREQNVIKTAMLNLLGVSSSDGEKLEKKHVPSLYVCGSPGTGKTMVVSHVLSQIESEFSKTNSRNQLRVIQMNGMAYSSPNDFVTDLVKRCTNKDSRGHQGLEYLNKLAKHTTSPILVIIDEIDAVLGKGMKSISDVSITSGSRRKNKTTSTRKSESEREDLDSIKVEEPKANNKPKKGVRRTLCKSSKPAKATNDIGLEALYTLFTLSKSTLSPVHVIGISNSINTIEKSLPMLTKVNAQPKTVIFQPYKSPQIVALLKHIVSVAANEPSGKRSKIDDPGIPGETNSIADKLFHPMALEKVARTVGKSSGDLRKVLEICGSAMDLAMESYTVSTSPISGKRSRCSESIEVSTEKPLVSLATMSTTIKRSRYSVSAAIENLTIDSLVVLLSIFATREKKEPTADMATVRKQYSKFCRLTGQGCRGSSGVDLLFQFLQSQGIIELNDRKKLVSLKVNWEDVQEALEGTAVMSVLGPHVEDPS